MAEVAGEMEKLSVKENGVPQKQKAKPAKDANAAGDQHPLEV